jgi:hypothetical protein
MDEVRAFPVRNLSQVIELLNGKQPWIPLAVDLAQLLAQRDMNGVDFKDVKGQYQAKRAMELAVAGGHNILICKTVYLKPALHETNPWRCLCGLILRENEKAAPESGPI